MTHRPPSEEPPVEIPIRDGMIRLGQLLKLSGVLQDGGEVREAIERGQVSVNGRVETRRGRQLHPGDVVAMASARLLLTSG